LGKRARREAFQFSPWPNWPDLPRWEELWQKG
jgi:hypothetical protein